MAARLQGLPEERLDALVGAAMGSPERLADLADPQVEAARSDHLALVGRLLEQGTRTVVPSAKAIDRWAKGRAKTREAVNAAELTRLEEAFGGEWPAGIKTRLGKRFKRLEREEQQRALRLVLDDLASYLRDLLAVEAGAPIVNTDQRASLERDARRVTVGGLLQGLHAVAECLEALELNGNPELHLERLLLRLGACLRA